jgi:hypothetical protein
MDRNNMALEHRILAVAQATKGSPRHQPDSPLTAGSRATGGLSVNDPHYQKSKAARTRKLDFKSLPLHKRKEIEDKVKKELQYGKLKNYGIRLSDVMYDGNKAISFLREHGSDS